MHYSSDRPFASEFKLSITQALADQLFETLEKTELGDLTTENLRMVGARPGIYELHHRKGLTTERVYVGKAESDLQKRLQQHWLKLSGRENISIEDILFKCSYVDEDLDSLAPERMLISRFKKEGSLPWNTNGFGNNDPGRNRDLSLVKADHFDSLYPARMDLRPFDVQQILKASISFPEEGESALEVLTKLKSNLPYVLRFEDPRKKPRVISELGGVYPAYSEGDIEMLSIDEWIERIIAVLDDGWQASVLPGYIILYKQVQNIPSARWIWRNVGGSPKKILGTGELGHRFQ